MLSQGQGRQASNRTPNDAKHFRTMFSVEEVFDEYLLYLVE